MHLKVVFGYSYSSFVVFGRSQKVNWSLLWREIFLRTILQYKSLILCPYEPELSKLRVFLKNTLCFYITDFLQISKIQEKIIEDIRRTKTQIYQNIRFCGRQLKQCLEGINKAVALNKSRLHS